MAYVSSIERIGRQIGYQEGMLQGQHQSEIAVLTRLLKRKFGDAPSSYLNQINMASNEQLLTWIERILDANSIAEIFA